MTPKEKAIELINKFLNEQNNSYFTPTSLQCALICIDEILENNYGAKFQMIFWQEVKQEINKL